MERANSGKHSLFKQFFSKRVSSLSKNVEGIFKKRTFSRSPLGQDWLKRSSGIFILVIAIVCGHFAQKISEARAIDQWTKTRFPSLDVWTAGLESRGFLKNTSNNTLDRLLRSLPTSVDDAGSIWLTSEKNWLILFLDKEAATPPHLFFHRSMRESKITWKMISKLAWERKGQGWVGFDQTLKDLEVRQLPEFPKKPATQRRTLSTTDPREIQY